MYRTGPCRCKQTDIVSEKITLARESNRRDYFAIMRQSTCNLFTGRVNSLRTMGQQTRVEWFYRTVPAVATLAALALVAGPWWLSRQAAGIQERTARQLIGKNLSSVISAAEHAASDPLLPPLGMARIVYFFRRDCGVCSSVREEIALRLNAFARSSVVTASSEDAAELINYWETTAIAGSRPVHLGVETRRAIGLSHVPTILLSGPDGRVTHALVGRPTDAMLDGFFAVAAASLSGEVRTAVNPN